MIPSFFLLDTLKCDFPYLILSCGQVDGLKITIGVGPEYLLDIQKGEEILRLPQGLVLPSSSSSVLRSLEPNFSILVLVVILVS